MLGLHIWDWVALISYFVGITIIGVLAARKISDTSDFFMAGRRFGKPFMVFFAFGAGTSGNDAVGVSAKTFTNGLSGIWWQWLWLFCTPFYWLIAPVMRRCRCLTTGDYYEQRYDGSVSGIYSLVGVLQQTVNVGIVQLGAASMIAAVTNDAVTRTHAILFMTTVFLIYGMAGGLAAAIITDFIQGILTVALSFILLPFALKAVGGFAGLHDKIDDPAMFSLVAPGEINLFYITMLCTSALLGIVTQPHIMGVCAAGRTEMDGRVGFAGGNLLKRFCTVAWMVVGLCAVVMYMDEPNVNPDEVYGRVAHDLLPQLMPGLIGIFIAALIASVMSSCDAFMVSGSGLFTQNFYRRWITSSKTERHYVWVGRIASFCIVAIGLSFAFTVEDVPAGLLWFFKIQALMAAPFWLGLFWRRATVAGAWAATLVGLAVLTITTATPFHEWASGAHFITEGETMQSFADGRGISLEELLTRNELEQDAEMAPGDVLHFAAPNLPPYMLWGDKFRDSWQIFFYLLGGFLAGIIVSLFTRRVPEEKLERFYGALRTPVHENEPHDPQPFSLPAGVTPPPPRKLINHPELEIPMPTLVGMGGFLFFWLWVGALIGFVFWMVTWGT